jgi:hypothetical protein
MGTDKTDPLKQKTQIFLLSVLVVRFDEGLEIVSSSMSAALPLWLNFSKTQLVIFKVSLFIRKTLCLRSNTFDNVVDRRHFSLSWFGDFATFATWKFKVCVSWLR